MKKMMDVEGHGIAAMLVRARTIVAVVTRGTAAGPPTMMKRVIVRRRMIVAVLRCGFHFAFESFRSGDRFYC